MKKMQIIDEKTGEVLEECHFSGDSLFQFMNSNGDIEQIGGINNGNFGLKHNIANWKYSLVAEQVAEKFQEIRHVKPRSILFLELVDWKPPASGAGRTWVARVQKANKYLENTWQYKYIMEIKEYYSSQMSKEQIVALLYHEMRHIAPNGKIQIHDVEDWGNMVATLGANWVAMGAEIVDLLDRDFPGWDHLKEAAGGQMSMFGTTGVDDASYEDDDYEDDDDD